MRKWLPVGGGVPLCGRCADMKRFLVRVKGAKEKFGVAASSLKELSKKAVKQLNVDPKASVTLVLAEDGTIVEDQDYFLCLPENTEFILLTGNQKWSPCQIDGGTMWMAQESEELDDVDSIIERPKWKLLAAELKQNLATIVLFSDSDYQALIDVQTEELCKEMAITDRQAAMLQDTLQNLLDRRAEERECKELLQLYLKAMNKEKANVDDTDSKAPALEEPKTQLPSHVINVLREKTSPQLSLSNQQLEDVQKQNLDALSADLNWDTKRVRRLQHECEEELTKRYQKVHYMHALSSASQHNKHKAESMKRGCPEARAETESPKVLCPVTAHCSSSP
ncbi:DNA fragmentation factor subunit alpha isoform X2 [Ranitomeya imitator]|uniref:DNA fragmentation factor subunit alpha isoform X2 n=1 Tax=Ranitomeya imitator TaxID=111125 RepID=UPI0037E7A5F7